MNTNCPSHPSVPRSLFCSLLVLLCIVTGSPVRGQDQETGQKKAIDYREAIELLDAAVRHEVEHKQLPAFSIAVVDDGEIVSAEGYGFQDAERKIPASGETVYRVGSISKLFTDICVMQQVEKDALDLDAPIEDYLPDLRPRNSYGGSISLRQLMSHRSGLVRESPVGNYFDPTEPTLDATVASLNSTSLVYAPGTRTKYSNAAVAVVGAVLESQVDESHPDLVRKKILDPLQMRGSGFEITPLLRPKLATGWMWTYDGRRRFQAPDFLLGTGPAGNLYSSVSDLSKFMACLFADGKAEGGPILKAKTIGQMTSPLEDSSGKPLGFGIGFHVQDFDGYTKIGHGGAVYGFSTQLSALPERKLGVVAASSLDGSNGVVDRLADYALRLMIAVQDEVDLPEYRTTVPIAGERVQELIGTYREIDGNRFARITELAGKVYLLRGTFRRALGADSGDGRVVTDDVFGFGNEVKLQDGNTLVTSGSSFKRIEDQPPAKMPQRWRGLIGEYGWDHNTLYVLEDNNQLFVLIEWFYYYPLTEIDSETFQFPDYGLYHGERLHFDRDDAGVARSVVAAEVRFERREIGTRDGETFQIEPVRPIRELRAEALAAEPPQETGDYREADLVDLKSVDSTFKLDIRYASKNNFTGSVFYNQARAFMQRPAAEALMRANQRLKSRGLGLLVHDAYRPWYVTKMFWDATPENMKDFVANPASGSRHNRGCAVDITLYELESGRPITMVAGYDEFSQRSFPLYPGGTARKRWYRDLLRRVLESEGFAVYEYEWWHFDYHAWKEYRIGNLTFEEIDRSMSAVD